MTENEAKTKWCPHSRSWSESGAANRGRDGQVNSEDMCLGSHCMAWRWVNSASSRDKSGYCGLAGKP